MGLNRPVSSGVDCVSGFLLLPLIRATSSGGWWIGGEWDELRRVETRCSEGAIRLLKSNGNGQPIEGYLAFQQERKEMGLGVSVRQREVEARHRSRAPMDCPLGVDRVGDGGVEGYLLHSWIRCIRYGCMLRVGLHFSFDPVLSSVSRQGMEGAISNKQQRGVSQRTGDLPVSRPTKYARATCGFHILCTLFHLCRWAHQTRTIWTATTSLPHQSNRQRNIGVVYKLIPRLGSI